MTRAWKAKPRAGSLSIFAVAFYTAPTKRDWRRPSTGETIECRLEFSSGQRITVRSPLYRCPPTHGGCGNSTNQFLSDCVSQTLHACRRMRDSGQNGGGKLKLSSKAFPTATLRTKD